MSALAKLIRLAGELGASVVEGEHPNPAYIAEQLAPLGVELVGAEAFAKYLSDAAAKAVNDKLDEEMRSAR